MKPGWAMKSIDDLAFVGRGKSRHRPRNEPSLYGGHHPFVQTADVHAADLTITNYSQTYSDKGLEQSKLWELGTICITNAGENTGDCAILGVRACFPDSIIGVIADERKSDTVFLKYAIDQLKPQLRQVTRGATQDNLSLAKLLAFKFPTPPTETQKRVGAVLGVYGSLIDNNRRRMELLEKTARLLYQAWFLRLRFPGHEHTRTSNGIPQGWTRKPLNEILPDLREAANPADLDASTPYIGLEHMPRRSITLNEWGRADEVTSTKLRFKTGDILFGKIRPYFHKVGSALTDGVTSSDAIVLRPAVECFHGFALLTVSSDWFITVVSKTAKEGSKMPRADWNLMEQHQILVPPHSILLAVQETVAPILEQLRTLSFSNHKLRAARDLLLPRLMSREIAV